eukprot:2909320-Pleurochrysis_carterae.AAC.1
MASNLLSVRFVGASQGGETGERRLQTRSAQKAIAARERRGGTEERRDAHGHQGFQLFIRFRRRALLAIGMRFCALTHSLGVVLERVVEEHRVVR